MILRTGAIGENATDRSIRKRIQNASLQADLRRRARESGYSVDASVATAADASAEIAVVKAINGSAQNGIGAEYIDVTILLPVGSQEQLLRDIVDEICRTCVSENVKIADAKAEVTPAVGRAVVLAAAWGRSYRKKSSQEAKEKNKSGVFPGQSIVGHSIVMSKWAGVEGTYLLSTILAKRLEDHFPVAMIRRTKNLQSALTVQREAEIAVTSHSAGVSAMVKLGDGGVFAALWELSRVTGRGFTVDLQRIPILQETIEYANDLDINPYQMKSEGSLLMVAMDGNALAGELRQQGIPATVIGQITEVRDKLIVNGEDTRCVDLPQPDALLELLDGGKMGD